MAKKDKIPPVMIVDPDAGGSVVCRDGQTRKEALAEQANNSATKVAKNKQVNEGDSNADK